MMIMTVCKTLLSGDKLFDTNYLANFNKLSTMYYNLIFVANFLIYKKCTNLRSLVSRYLNYTTMILIVCDRSITFESFL